MGKYKLEYIEQGIKQEITSAKVEPLQTLLRHLFAVHNKYSGIGGEFELLFFGEVNNGRTYIHSLTQHEEEHHDDS